MEDLEKAGIKEMTIDDLPEEMKNKLIKNGIDKLFPVQSSSFSLFVNEKSELVVKSKTGTGKTLSFLMPIEYLLHHGEQKQSRSNKIKAIILEPTRELAIQVQSQVEKFTNLSSSLLYGGGDSKRFQCKYF